MTTNLIKKNIKLSNEFDEFVAGNQSASKKIPNGAHIVITSSRDAALSAANTDIARNSRGGIFVEAHKSDGRWQIKAFQK